MVQMAAVAADLLTFKPLYLLLIRMAFVAAEQSGSQKGAKGGCCTGLSHLETSLSSSIPNDGLGCCSIPGSEGPQIAAAEADLLTFMTLSSSIPNDLECCSIRASEGLQTAATAADLLTFKPHYHLAFPNGLCGC